MEGEGEYCFAAIAPQGSARAYQRGLAYSEHYSGSVMRQQGPAGYQRRPSFPSILARSLCGGGPFREREPCFEAIYDHDGRDTPATAPEVYGRRKKKKKMIYLGDTARAK